MTVSLLTGRVLLFDTSVDFMSGKGQQHIFTSTQIWVWCSVLIDLTITTCLAVHLHTLKQGFNPK